MAGQLGSFADGRVSTSVGITIIDEAGLPYKVLYERADKALYSAKNNGKNTYCIDGVLF